MSALVPLIVVLLISVAQPAADFASVPAEDLRVASKRTEPTTRTQGLGRVPEQMRSPDRRRVARVQPGTPGIESRQDQLVITGPGRRRVVIGAVVNYSGMAWSPDGRKIAYCEGAILHIADADGRTRQVLHKGPGGPYPGACFDLAWSSDGRTLSFTEVENADQLDISTPDRITITLGTKAGSQG